MLTVAISMIAMLIPAARGAVEKFAVVNAQAPSLSQAMAKIGCSETWLTVVMKNYQLSFSDARDIPPGTAFAVPPHCEVPAPHALVRSSRRSVLALERRTAATADLEAQNAKLQEAEKRAEIRAEQFRMEVQALITQNARSRERIDALVAQMDRERAQAFGSWGRFFLGIAVGVIVMLAVVTALWRYRRSR